MPFPANWPRAERGALYFGSVLFLGFFVFALASLFVQPSRGEQFISIAVGCMSLGFALICFAFLRHQTANIQFSALGLTVQVGGAVAAALVTFVVLQFAIRGTTSLYVSLSEDGKPWSQANTSFEFALSLPEYDIVARSDGDAVRFRSMPVSAWSEFKPRNSSWYVRSLSSDEATCRISGSRLTGWCSRVEAKLVAASCNSRWRGAGRVDDGTFLAGLMKLEGQVQKALYSGQLRPDIDEVTRKALEQPIAGYEYGNNAGFCAAINPARVQVEQKLGTGINIEVACGFISVVASSSKSGSCIEK